MARNTCPSFSAAPTLGLSDQQTETRLDRLIKAIGAVYAPLTVEAAIRAGVLRGEASRGSRRHISTTDAQIVAMAEERSYRCAVTIITGDPHDINMLVGLTRRTNIAVDVPS
jgi:predicted nucleic acid-binding protein